MVWAFARAAIGENSAGSRDETSAAEHSRHFDFAATELPIPWSELVPRWNQSRDGLEECIRNFPVAELPKQVPGRTYAYEFLYRGAVEHVIYHSGQIAMVLSMLRSRRP